MNDTIEKIREYLKKPELAIEHGENGYSYAKINFDRTILAEDYINQINKII